MTSTLGTDSGAESESDSEAGTNSGTSLESAQEREPSGRPTRIIHTGDTHIGYQQYHSPERRQDFIEAFGQVISDAIEDDVDAVVHAGDLFHDRRPSLPDILGTLERLRRLDAADIPFLAVVGNHESTRGGQWLDLFENMDLAIRLGTEPVIIEDTAFYGLDHVPESRRDELDYAFEPADNTTTSHRILVSHGLFTPFAHANWDTELVLEESTVDFDAILLGDNHVADTVTVDDTWVTYCGSTERTSTSEERPRGYNLISFNPTAPGPDGVDIRRRTIDTRPFVFVDVELAAGEGVGRVRDRVTQHELQDAVVIVRIEGDGEPITPASIEETALDAGALIARVTDKRDVDETDEISVSFADPDDAVRERISDIGLSPAAREFDSVIRSDTVPDSNVRETVKQRLSDRIEAEGLEGLLSTDSDQGDTSRSGESSESESVGTVDSKTETTGDAIEDSQLTATGVSTDESSVSSSDDSSADSEADSTEATTDESTEDSEEHSDDRSPTDGQRSMEEYL